MYCTVDNIKALVPQSLLDELTSGDDAVIEKAIATAEATMNVYLAGSYYASDAQNSEFLQTVAEKITVYNLYANAAFDETPQIVATSYQEAISSLEKIQQGLLSLTSSDEATRRQSEVFINKTSSDKLFGSNLKGF